MASSLDSVLECVVWKITDKNNYFPKTVTSESFFLFGFESNLELCFDVVKYKEDNICLTVQIKTSLDFEDRVTTRLRLMIGDHQLLSRDTNLVGSVTEIGSFEHLNRKCLVDLECECIFRSAIPLSHNRAESGTTILTTWNPNLQSLSSDFVDIMQDKTFTDVTLKCRDRTLSAHRVVLAARSPVFAAMFRNKMAESETGVVDLSDLDPDVLESFIKYLYSGTVADLSDVNVASLFSTSDQYAVRPLQRECSKYIGEHLTRDNYVSFLQLAGAHKGEDLINGIARFISTDSSMLKSDEWSRLKASNPELALVVYEKYNDILQKNQFKVSK